MAIMQVVIGSPWLILSDVVRPIIIALTSHAWLLLSDVRWLWLAVVAHIIRR